MIYSIFKSGDLFGKTRIDNNLISATIELTYKCNLQCSHCFLGNKRYLIKQEVLTSKIVYNLIDQLAELGCLFLTFTGGEIFLREDLFKILKYARKRKFSIRLFTNATLINSVLAKRIKEIQPSAVEISLYSLKKDVFERITGVIGSYDKVINAISCLKKNKIKLYLKTPLFKENFSELKSLIAYAESMRARFICDLFMRIPEDGTFSSLKHRLSEIERKKHIVEFYDKLCTPKPSRNPRDGICSAGRHTLAISAFGDIQPCLEWRTQKHNVQKETIRKAWLNGEVFKFARALKWKDIVKCRDCSFFSYCFFCPVMELKEYGTLSFKDSECCWWGRLRKEAADKLKLD